MEASLDFLSFCGCPRGARLDALFSRGREAPGGLRMVWATGSGLPRVQYRLLAGLRLDLRFGAAAQGVAAAESSPVRCAHLRAELSDSVRDERSAAVHG